MRTTLLFCLLLYAFPILAQHVEYRPETLVRKKLYNPRDLLLDANGDIYVADNQTTRVFDKEGQFKKEYAFQNTGTEVQYNELKSSLSLAQDKQGNLYIMGRNRLVRKIDKEGRSLLTFGGFNDAGSTQEYSKGIAVDTEGYTYVVFNMTGQVYKYDMNGTLVKTFAQSSSEKGDKPGNFWGATQICIDPTGNLQVVDQHNGRVQVLTPNGEFVRQIGKAENQGAPLFPTDVAVDSHGNTYIADSISAMIIKFDSQGKLLSRIGARGPDNGKFTTADLRVALDQAGNIYVMDTHYLKSTCRIQKFDPQGRYVATLVDNREEIENTLIASDYLGNFVVANVHTGLIQRFNRNGQLIHSFTSKTDDQTIYFYNIKDIKIDKDGNIYVLEQSQNGGMKKFDPTGKLIKRFAPTHSLGSGREDDFSVPYYPYNFAFDSKGYTYLADYNHVFKYDLKGEYVSKFKLPYETSTDSIVFNDTHGFNISNGDILYLIHPSGAKKFDVTGNFMGDFSPSDINTDSGNFPKDIDFDLKDNIYLGMHGFLKKYNAEGKLLSTSGFHPTLINTGRYANFSVNSSGSKIAVAANGTVSIFSSSEISDTYKPGKFYITGTVYSDQNANCLQNTYEKGLSGIALMATPGPYYGVTDGNGNYSIEVDSGSYVITQILPENKVGRSITPTCDPTDQSQYTTIAKVTSGPNFGNRVFLSPYLSVSVSSTRRRRCFESTTTVRYENSGFATAPDTKVYLQLPKEVELLSADKPYTLLPNGTYEFRVGDLAAGQSGTITIQDIVTCGDESVRGLTVCARAWITPSNNKPAEPTPTVSITGRCHAETGMIRFVVRNMGTADMDQYELFRKFANGELASQEQFRLAAGDSLVLWVPSMGYTWRLEADQPDGNGDNTAVSVTIEGCPGEASNSVSTGMVNLLPSDDEEAEKSEECMPITDSYDPNDKLVTPVGRTEEFYTPTNTALKYKIRFQNTGTDVAYRIVVVDTLSEHLDLSTLQLGATSHPSRVEVSGKGRPVLIWTFDNIMLPDSTADEPGSHGYIQFSIKPKAGLPEKTLVENFADIFFDFNSPIRTNVTQNRIYDMPPVINESVRVHLEDVLATPGIAGFSPAAGKFGTEVTITGQRFASKPGDNKVYLNGKAATVVSATGTELKVLVPTGTATGNLKVITPDGGVTSADKFEVYQPPVLSSFSPAEGMVGQTVTLSGEHLQAELIEEIRLGHLTCEILSSNSSTLTVRVPAAAATGKFQIRTKGGEALSSAAYTVWYAPGITGLSKQTDIVGARITITGEHFAADKARNQVRFGQALAEVLEASPQQLTVRVPEGAASGFISVETPGGKATATTTFEVIPGPKFTAMQPASGTVGTVVEITGEHFGIMGQRDKIVFNGQEALVLESAGDRYKVRVPRGASTGKVTIIGYGGKAHSSSDFEVEELAPAEAITVYPNPNNGQFTVSLRHADFDVQQIEVYDALGKRLHQTHIPGPSPETVEISLPAAKAGLYFLQIQTERGMITKKLTVL